jgi:periplasmic divalent cation tolerance protein
MRQKVQYQMVMTTTGSEEEARQIAALAVDTKMAACAQIEPIHSVYRWKGKVESAPEWRVTIKTIGAKVAPLMELIRSHHSYEVPEIIAVPILDGLPAYLQWIDTETAP